MAWFVAGPEFGLDPRGLRRKVRVWGLKRRDDRVAETPRMRTLSQAIHVSVQSATPSADPHGGQALRVPPVSPEVQPEWARQDAPSYAAPQPRNSGPRRGD